MSLGHSADFSPSTAGHAEPLSDAWVHDVYRCAMDELPWEAVLRPLVKALNAECAGVLKHSIAPVTVELLAKFNVEPDTEQAYLQHYVYENPMISCLSAMPLGYVTTGSGAVDERYYFDSKFYTDWQKPSGYSDNMVISLARRQGQFVSLFIPRHFDNGVYPREATSIIVPYMPHLVRAFNIWLRINMAEAQNGWVTEAFDQMAQGLMILGQDRIILYANKGGERVLAANGPLQRVNFRLRAVQDEIADKLDAILRLFETGQADETAEYALAIPRSNGQSPLFVRVQPPIGVRPGQKSFGMPMATAFLHVVDPDERTALNLKPFAEGYRLTSAELRFVEALMRTESIVEAARVVGITEATARFHMQHVYSKTGATSLAALLAQVYRSALP
ncbi:MAG: helix-turn-helix transcriptional regulator [Beijerinckiaceae bacterium]